MTSLALAFSIMSVCALAGWTAWLVYQYEVAKLQAPLPEQALTAITNGMACVADAVQRATVVVRRMEAALPPRPLIPGYRDFSVVQSDGDQK